jgi:hypothetical protein
MLNFNDLVAGEFISLTQYFKVKSINKKTGQLFVTNDDGEDIVLEGKSFLETNLYSAAQYSEIITCKKSDLVDVLRSAKDQVFAVCYLKQDKTERLLIGHYIKDEPNLGRTLVRDLEIDKKDKTKGFRLVDNREIKFVIFNNVKYIFK